MMAKKEDVQEKLVFDDDTDDSDDDLDIFRNRVSNTVSSQLAPASDSESDTVEDGIVNEKEESDTDSSEASEGSDQESEESETEKINREKVNTVINNKLGKLSSLLATKNKEESKSSSEEEESEDESDSENEDKSESEEDGERTKNVSKSIEDNDKKEQTSDNNDEDFEKGKYVKLPKKRKIDDVETESDEGETEQQQQETESEINKEEEARSKYRETLSKLPVQQILEIKAKLGDKIFNSKWSDGKPKKLERSKMKQEFKRADKNRPREMSSKIKVPAYEKVKQVNKPERRDPRFDPLCGEFDKKSFRRQYGFLKDFKNKELVVLKEQLKDAQGEERSKIKYLIQRMENQLRSQRDLEEKEKKTFEESKNMKEKLDKGEKPVYKNKKTIREEGMVEKYERLKRDGKLDKYIMKKSKENTSKDRKLFGDLI